MEIDYEGCLHVHCIAVLSRRKGVYCSAIETQGQTESPESSSSESGCNIEGAVGESPGSGRADIQEDDSASGSATPRELTLPMESGCGEYTPLAPVTCGNDDSAVSGMRMPPLGPRRDLAYITFQFSSSAKGQTTQTTPLTM